MQIRIKGVNTVRRYRKDGSFALYRYHRATGRQLVGQPGTPEFIESYAAAEKSARERAKGTIGDLIRRFEGTPEQPNPVWEDFEESTKVEYRRKFKVIDGKWGTAPISSFNEKEFRKDALDWRDKIAKRARREADNLMSALARLGSWAFDRGEVDRNVLDKVTRVYHSDRANKLWLPAHVAAFVCMASSEMKAALMLGMHTGQRQGDLRRLPWTAYDGERITLRQSKGGKVVSIRCTKALRAMLDEMALEKKGLLILTTPTGRAWTKRYFNQHWNATAVAANITDLHFHDLRGTAVTMLAEAGCTVPEIAAVTGHSLKHVTHILEVYLSRTRALADAAIVKLDRRVKRLQKGS
ncbi:MAG: tyrosine-type recombinase/integrase [Xanthobacteraceae bacterium]